MPQVHQAREALGAHLRELRVGAGLKGNAFAAAAGWPPSRVSRLEHGQQTPTLEDLHTWADLCRCDAETVERLRHELATVETFYREWRKQVRAGLHAKQRSLAEEEARTRVLRVFEPLLIPGLLQTADYARAMLQQSARELSMPLDVEEAVRERIRRQDILYQHDKTIHIVITEAALRLGTAGVEVMRGQMDRLAVAAGTTGRVRLGIVPFGTLLPVAPQHGYWIHDRELVFVETVSAELKVTHPDEIAMYLREFELTATVAYYDQAARDLIARAAAGWSRD